MKQLSYLIAITFTLITLHGMCRAEGEREEQPRSKGTELYSWKDQQGEWVFKLVYGTNRLKLEEEIKNGQAQIEDLEDLRQAFARLAVGENVSWSHLVRGFELPPEATVEKIEKFAKDAEITLRIYPAPVHEHP